MPASTMVLRRPLRSSDDRASARQTAASAPANAAAVTAAVPDKNRMPAAAPALAPDDTPMDIRRGQRVAEHGLVDKARNAERKAADDADGGAAEPQRPEHAPLHGVPAQQAGQGQRIFAAEQAEKGQGGQQRRPGQAEGLRIPGR